MITKAKIKHLEKAVNKIKERELYYKDNPLLTDEQIKKLKKRKLKNIVNL